VLAGFEGERGGEVGLAGAGRAEEADVAVLLDPGQLGEVQHERPLRRRLRAPVEVLECLEGGAGVADAHAGTRGVAGEDLGLEQRLEEALVRPLLLARQGRGLLEPLQHPGRLQLAEQVRESFARLCRRRHVHRLAVDDKNGSTTDRNDHRPEVRRPHGTPTGQVRLQVEGRKPRRNERVQRNIVGETAVGPGFGSRQLVAIRAGARWPYPRSRRPKKDLANGRRVSLRPCTFVCPASFEPRSRTSSR
jgi:hypothetical protein